MEDIRLVYITAESNAQADLLASTLVATRLAACVNILGDIRSVYLWKGAVEHATEVALLAKTTANQIEDLTRKVKELHTYETPCVIALPVDRGNLDYFVWLAESCRA